MRRPLEDRQWESEWLDGRVNCEVEVESGLVHSKRVSAVLNLPDMVVKGKHPDRRNINTSCGHWSGVFVTCRLVETSDLR
jgi:hypothetical protein